MPARTRQKLPLTLTTKFYGERNARRKVVRSSGFAHRLCRVLMPQRYSRTEIENILLQMRLALRRNKNNC